MNSVLGEAILNADPSDKNTIYERVSLHFFIINCLKTYCKLESLIDVKIWIMIINSEDF